MIYKTLHRKLKIEQNERYYTIFFNGRKKYIDNLYLSNDSIRYVPHRASLIRLLLFTSICWDVGNLIIVRKDLESINCVNPSITLVIGIWFVFFIADDIIESHSLLFVVFIDLEISL
jgi:hypothetical protein